MMRSVDLRILSPENCAPHFFLSLSLDRAHFFEIIFVVHCYDCSRCCLVFWLYHHHTITWNKKYIFYFPNATQTKLDLLTHTCNRMSMVLLNHSLQFIRQFIGPVVRLWGIKYIFFSFLLLLPYLISFLYKISYRF